MDGFACVWVAAPADECGGMRAGKPRRCKVCRKEAVRGFICESCNQDYRAAANLSGNRCVRCDEPLRHGAKGACGFCEPNQAAA